MNLDELVTHYIAFRRTLGEKFKTNESILRSFCRTVGPKTSTTNISAEVVSAFLGGSGSVTSGWFTKYRALNGFFRFAISRGHLTDAQAGPVQQQQNRPKGIRLDQGAVVLGRLDRIQQPTDLASGVDIRHEWQRRLGEGLRQRGLGEMSAADSEAEESIERSVLGEPPARD